MKATSMIFSLFLFNLIVGNVIVSVIPCETVTRIILLHAIFSVISILLILQLIWFFQRKNGFFTIILCSMLSSFLVPTISIYALIVGYGVSQLEFDSLLKGIPIAVIAGIVSWFLWLPIGAANSVFFIAYTRKLKRDTIVS